MSSPIEPLLAHHVLIDPPSRPVFVIVFSDAVGGPERLLTVMPATPLHAVPRAFARATRLDPSCIRAIERIH